MNIRIKIGDFPREAHLECLNGFAVADGREYPLPEHIILESSAPEDINFTLRLFHLHSMEEAEAVVNNLPGELSSRLDIIRIGERWGGAGIDRYWIVRERFSNESEAYAWLEEAGELIGSKMNRRLQIEGGIYKIYPESPGKIISAKNPDGKTLFRGRRIRISAPAGVTVFNAPVGETFHWEHTENLVFSGSLLVQAGERRLLMVNEVPLEEYLSSVNSSEMSAQAPIEFLKAQTIAARGTVSATMGCHHHGEPFDLCNGDHCQCYYGTGRVDERSLEASEATKGELLVHNGVIADTRYGKICGGIRERFNRVWEIFDPPYLPARFDGKGESPHYRKWVDYILDSPRCYCNPEIYPYPDYLDYARGWFRWDICLKREELSEIIRRRTGCDVGTMEKFEVLSRGDSGRTTGLKIFSEGKDIDLYGELNIRRALSESHLPSSCFEAEIDYDKVIFHGAGWGHGVGMCQMGGLSMALMGLKCGEILAHYYPSTELIDLQSLNEKLS